ncbi:hypothetical protein HWI79_1174 [Cryptosporidium felis]|nr:hypothetical protein HWI79_1174 [Cryptosporidium felis]
MKAGRDYLVKYMSEIFDDIPDVVIGDIFDHLVSENVILSKQLRDNVCPGDTVSSVNYEQEIVQVCEALYEKLIEISAKSFYQEAQDSGSLYFVGNHQNNLDLSPYFPDLSQIDLPHDHSRMSYLSACLKSNPKLGDEGNWYRNISGCSNSGKASPPRTGVSGLRKRPWDVLAMQSGELVGSEVDMLRGILGEIFNSAKFFRVRESKCRKWPPDGPGKETMTIPLRSVKVEYYAGKSDLNSLEDLKRRIQDLNALLDEECSRQRRILTASNIKEYKLIKLQEFNDRIKSIKSEKKLLQVDHFNLLFNTQNSGFIDFILGKSKYENQVNIDLHNYTRNEASDLMIFCIVMILKFKFKTEFKSMILTESLKSISEEELTNSQKSFKGDFVDIWVCVGVGNHNSAKDNKWDEGIHPKLASLIRRMSFALNLPWRFGSSGFIVIRLQDNVDWLKYLKGYYQSI